MKQLKELESVSCVFDLFALFMTLMSLCLKHFDWYPILWMYLFTISLQFIRGLPGLLLNPVTSHCSTCFGMHTSSILVTWPSHIPCEQKLELCTSSCGVGNMLKDVIWCVTDRQN